MILYFIFYLFQIHEESESHQQSTSQDCQRQNKYEV